MSEVTVSLLEQILEKTYKKVLEDDNFDEAIIEKLRNASSGGNLSNKEIVDCILSERGEIKNEDQ